MISANFLKFLEFLFFQFSLVDAAVINDSRVSLIRTEPIFFIPGSYASVSFLNSRPASLNAFFTSSIFISLFTFLLVIGSVTSTICNSRYLSTLFNSSTKDLRSYFPIAESISPIPISGNASLYLLSIL